VVHTGQRQVQQQRVGDLRDAGRRFLLAYAVLSLATAFAPNLGVFLLLRLLTGAGLGAELTLVDTYLSELLPSARRGRYVAWSYTFGLLAVPVADILAKAANTTIAGWAGLALAADPGRVRRCAGVAVPPWAARVTALAGRHGPHRGSRPGPHRDRARDAGRRRADAAGAQRPVSPAGRAVPPPDGVDVGDADHRPGRVLHVRSIAPIVLLAKGLDLAHSLTYSAPTAVGYPLGSLVSVYLTERFERRTLLIASTLAVAAFGVLFGVGTNIGLVVAAGIATTISTVVQSNLTHTYQAELFHTANRGTAIGLPYAASRLVSALLPLGALTLLSAVGAGGLYACCALLLTVMAVVIRQLGPRTNNQRLDTI
jgi:putative MFS transporter